jgi:hypothetical protein
MTSPFRTSTTPAGCISDLQLDKWQAGELSEQAEKELTLHVATCARCSQKRQRLAANAERFLQQFPEPPRANAAASRSANKRGYWVAAATTGLAVAAALVLWLRTPVGQFGTRSKGTAHLGFFVERAGEVTRGLPSQSVFAGDRLRFVVTTSKPQQLAILGRDGTGAAFVYHPDSARSALVGAGRDLALASTIELDNAPGTESIWAVFCDEPFDVAPLKAALLAKGALPELAGCTVDSLRLPKGSRP